MCITKENFPKFVDLVTEFTCRTGLERIHKRFLNEFHLDIECGGRKMNLKGDRDGRVPMEILRRSDEWETFFNIIADFKQFMVRVSYATYEDCNSYGYERMKSWDKFCVFFCS